MKFILAFLALLVSFDHVQIKAIAPWSPIDIPGNQLSNASAERNSNNDIQKIMEVLKSNLSTAADQTMAKLDSMLLLQGHPHISQRLRSKITAFTDILSVHLERDLSEAVAEYKSMHGSDPLADEEYDCFSQIIREKWEETLSSDLIAFQKTILPRFVNSIQMIWHGLEEKVINNIEKFKNMMQTRIPRFSDECSIPKIVLTGSNHLNYAEPSSLEMGKKSVIVYLAEIALIAAAVIGVIALATAGPILLLFVALWVFKDHLAYRIHGPL